MTTGREPYRLHPLQCRGGGAYVMKWITCVTHDEVIEHLVLPASEIVSREYA